MTELEFAGPSVALIDAAKSLLREALLCAQKSQLHSAELLLSRAWNLVSGAAPELADQAAWDRAWLAMRAGAYTEAAQWFARVACPPHTGTELWEATRRALAEADVSSTAATTTAIPPSLRIENLGGFMIWRGEQLLPLPRARQPLAIFRYLLARHKRRAERDELVEIFWPDTAPEVASHRLHVAVNELRRILGSGGLVNIISVAGQYAVNPAAVIWDTARQFTDLCAAAHSAEHAKNTAAAHQLYQRAIECYAGDYYLDGRDGSWALMERERLLSLYLVALDRQSALAILDVNYELAIAACRQLLERDCYREDIHCRLIRSYLMQGRRAEACQQYARCAAILADELGLEPMSETRSLYAEVSRLSGG